MYMDRFSFCRYLREPRKYGYEILLLLFLAWMCVGVFPLHCYESDSMHTIVGCEVLRNQGFTLPPVYSYQYDMQPLIYYVVAGGCRLLPFLSCEEMFCLLTAVAAALAVVVCVRFVHRLTGIRREWILFALFLLPESVAIGMYPNTAIFAMLPFVLALDCLLRKRLRAAVAWMCLAPLFRVDILMVYPVIFPIFLWQKDSLAAALRKSVCCAVVIVAATALCYWLLRANPLGSTMDAYGRWNEEISLLKKIESVFSFYTALGIPLFLGGICRIAKKREWLLLTVVLVPVVLNHVVYGKMCCATKHFLYILPFVALAVSVALVFLNDWLRTRKVLRYAAWGALVVFLLVSVRIAPPGRPWWDIPGGGTQIGPCLSLWHENRTSLKFSVGIGAGFQIKTADERMLASGNFFYPFNIRIWKKYMSEARAEACERLAGVRRYTLWGISWEEMALLPSALQADGWTLFDVGKESDSRKFVLHSPDGEKSVTVTRARHFPSWDTDLGSREEKLRDMVRTLSADGAPYYLFTCIACYVYYFDKFCEEGLAEKISDGLYQVFPQTK